jgi:fatty acid desaturase
MALLARGGIGVPATIATVLVVGNAYASMLLLAHEVMHGAVVRSPRYQRALAWLGFAPFLISPTLWRVWHNEVHHGRTNEPDRDPDIFAGEAMHASSPTTRWVLRFVPGSGGASSVLFPFVWFCAHGQIVLWFLSRRMPGFARLRRRRAELEAGAMALGWLGLAFAIGLSRAAVAILAPMAVGNCFLMSYIATNHLLRPLVTEPDPLRSSMSVRTFPLLDRLHFRFSHHVEHHLFPAMCGADLPRVRTWLRRHVPEEYVCPAHLRALVWLYRTPRTYRDAVTLVDPRRPSRAPFDLDRLTRSLLLAGDHAARRQGPTSSSADSA